MRQDTTRAPNGNDDDNHPLPSSGSVSIKDLALQELERQNSNEEAKRLLRRSSKRRLSGGTVTYWTADVGNDDDDDGVGRDLVLLKRGSKISFVSQCCDKELASCRV